MDNEVILSNLRRLAELGAPVTVRVPLIPGFNADAESFQPLRDLWRSRRRAKTCEPAALSTHSEKQNMRLLAVRIRWKVKIPSVQKSCGN